MTVILREIPNSHSGGKGKLGKGIQEGEKP